VDPKQNDCTTTYVDLLEGFFVALHLVDGHLHGGTILGNRPRALIHLGLQLRLFLDGQVPALCLCLLLFCACAFLDDGVELVHLFVKLAALLGHALLNGRDFELRTVTRLVRLVAQLDDGGHLILLFTQLFFQLLVDFVEHEALTTQIVDLTAQLLVVRQGFVELHQRLVQSVFQNAYLLVNDALLLLCSIHAANVLTLCDTPRDATLSAEDMTSHSNPTTYLLLDLGPHGANLLRELVQVLLFNLNLACVHVHLVVQPIERGVGHCFALRVASLQVELGFDILRRGNTFGHISGAFTTSMHHEITHVHHYHAAACHTSPADA